MERQNLAPGHASSRRAVRPPVRTLAGSVLIVCAAALIAATATARPPETSQKGAQIAPDEERFFANRMEATTTELSTSHVPMLSKPNEVAAVIGDAATKALQGSPKAN